MSGEIIYIVQEPQGKISTHQGTVKQGYLDWQWGIYYSTYSNQTISCHSKRGDKKLTNEIFPKNWRFANEAL